MAGENGGISGDYLPMVVY
ncbi:Protein of unknown function [Bacillus wiedmannii]|uniref:Uncharacterized protein n=1 Tax=Bacillus wiedmannii TaxID=1890302 RepID=A0AB37YQR6_9BACI|nr:Protein of unknown function [Bacillus wiedmannii]